MQHFAIIALLSITAALVGAQVTFNHTTNSFTCPSTGGSFCAGASLSTNIIIRCTGTVGRPGNCDDNLAGIPPVGIKDFAPCYEPSPTSGHAACSYNNIAYPDTGSPFPIPGSPNSTNASTSAMTTLANSSSTSSIPTQISAGAVSIAYASPFANISITIPAGATPSVPGIAKLYGPGSVDVTPSGPLAAYTGAVETGMASVTPATFMGGVWKLRAATWAMGIVVAAMSVFA